MVTVAVRWLNLKAARATIARPFASVVAVLAFRLPLVVEKETATPGMMALDESTSVAVRVAEVALSVRIKFADVPNAITPAVGVVVVPVVAVLSLQPASATIATPSMNNAENLVNVVLKKWSRTCFSRLRSQHNNYAPQAINSLIAIYFVHRLDRLQCAYNSNPTNG